MLLAAVFSIITIYNTLRLDNNTELIDGGVFAFVLDTKGSWCRFGYNRSIAVSVFSKLGIM